MMTNTMIVVVVVLLLLPDDDEDNDDVCCGGCPASAVGYNICIWSVCDEAKGNTNTKRRTGT